MCMAPHNMEEPQATALRRGGTLSDGLGEFGEPLTDGTFSALARLAAVVDALARLQQIGHVEHDGEVDQQNRYMEDALAVKQFVDFEGQVQGAGDQGDPLGPGSGVPKSVSLQEAQNGIRERRSGDGPYFCHGQRVCPIEEDLSKVVIRADMKKSEQAVGDIPGVFALHQQKNTARRQQYDQPLGELQCSNAAQHLEVASGPWLRGCDLRVHYRAH